MAVRNIIAQVIAREEAERKAAEEAGGNKPPADAGRSGSSQLPATSIISKPGQGNTTTPQTTQPGNRWKAGIGISIITQLVEQGKAEFQRLWGRRKLEDNWRRKNKTVVALDDFEEIDYSESEDIAPKDSIPNSQENEATSSVSPEKDPKKGTTDSIANDTHRPNTIWHRSIDRRGHAGIQRIAIGSFIRCGMVFRDHMHDSNGQKPCSKAHTAVPDFAQADEAYYQLFLTELAIEYYEKK